MEKIWLQSYQTGVQSEIDLEKVPSLIHLFEDSVNQYRHDVAFSNFGKKMSYDQLEKSSAAFAAFLQTKLSMVKAERIAIMMPNLLQYPIALFGALRAGMSVVNVNPLYTAKELAHQLADSGASTIVVLENFAHVVAQALPETQVQHVIITRIGDNLGFKGKIMNFVVKHIKKMVPRWHIEKTYTFQESIRQGREMLFTPVTVVGDDIAFLQYTGGTTGVSKGAVLTHRNILANVMQARNWIAPLGELKTEGGIITALPLYHIFSLVANCIAFFQFGIANILITNPRDLKGFIKELNRQPFCVLTGVNTLFNGLLRTPGFAQVNFKHFKLALGGGMAVQKAVADKWKEVTGVTLMEAYGLTECSPAVTINPLYITDYNGSIGLPLPSTEVEIRDENGCSVPIGQPGELCVKGPQVMQGYWKRPEETKKVLKDGWLYTGDIAVIDQLGFVRIVDRKKDMILVSGFNVYPNEVEEIIALHPHVAEVAVIGVPCAAGERVRAYVVKASPTLTAEELLAHCKLSLTNYKLPKEFIFRSELPKTNVGKVLRRVLRDEAVMEAKSNQVESSEEMP